VNFFLKKKNKKLTHIVHRVYFVAGKTFEEPNVLNKYCCFKVLSPTEYIHHRKFLENAFVVKNLKHFLLQTTILTAQLLFRVTANRVC